MVVLKNNNNNHNELRSQDQQERMWQEIREANQGKVKHGVRDCRDDHKNKCKSPAHRLEGRLQKAELWHAVESLVCVCVCVRVCVCVCLCACACVSACLCVCVSSIKSLEGRWFGVLEKYQCGNIQGVNIWADKWRDALVSILNKNLMLWVLIWSTDWF